jgi:hypothetical protein
VLDEVKERKDKFLSHVFKIKIEEGLLASKQLTGLYLNKKDPQIKQKQEKDLVKYRQQCLSQLLETSLVYCKDCCRLMSYQQSLKISCKF